MPKPSGHNNIWIEARATLILLFCTEVFVDFKNVLQQQQQQQQQQEEANVFCFC